MDWLHWIGKQYYTQKSFIKEAEKYRVSRRVAPQVAKAMNWGDTVYCAMLDGKTGVIFGYFTVDRITGLSVETTEQLKEKYKASTLDDGGNIIERGCGEYQTGETISIDASVEEITNEVIDIGNKGQDGDKLMVSGAFTEIEPIRLLDIPFRQGFRTINGIALQHDAEVNGNKVHGQFYLEAATKLWYESNKPQLSGEIQEVKKYIQNPNTRKKQQRKAIMPAQLSLI